uniref:Uncharacterized protein n=1 Tax=Noctiluca scintillans TaxID=2966 RepID=A0A7S1EYP4_NOCSC|mmetsp:Transcript_18285/g.49149  ORF Transcript_18285/g.49149 Transcript_18285/m.49149 type:complete len:331 (+) Transcript_18285:68-1060(+)
MSPLPLTLLALTANSSTLWESWKLHFGQQPTALDESIRYHNFLANLRFITEENLKSHHCKFGVNEFTSLTHEEFVAQHMGFREPAQFFGNLPSMGNHSWNGDVLPTSVDWVELGAVTPVKNQGQCGSCWSFSVSGALEGAFQIATGILTPLSEQQFVDCNHGWNMGCHGGFMDTAFAWARDHTLCTEASYPYKGKELSCKTSCETGIPSGVVVGYKDVAFMWFFTTSEQNMMSAVAQQPVSVAIEADRRVFQFYKWGVLNGDCGTRTNHAVLVVGYGRHPVGGEYWKLKNSWGSSWGLDGFILLKRDSGRLGECGVLEAPSFPVVHPRVV